MQEIGGALCMGGGGEDRPLVVFQDFQPIADIGGMVFHHFRGDIEIGAKEGRAEFGDQFFGGISFVAPPLAAKITVEAALVVRPVPLMPISA